MYHKAALFNSKTGGVMALCFKKPRSIDLNKSSWTICDEAVTCPKCLKLLMKEKPDEDQQVS